MIPIRNVYYMLCYAWRHAQEKDLVGAGAENASTLRDLLAHALGVAGSRLLKRGLDRNYVDASGAIVGVRGKLSLNETIRQQLLVRGRTYCEFDEFHYDIPANRILKAATGALLRDRNLDPQVAPRLRQIYGHMHDVSDVRIAPTDFGRVRIHRNNRRYDFVLKLCRLIIQNTLPAQAGSGTQFHDFTRDDARMAQLFEDFLFGFYDFEQDGFGVSRWQIDWHDAQGSEHDLQYLPLMRTDITLHRSGHIIVMDAKYYREALQGRYESDKVRSGHLYQILSYAHNLQLRHPDSTVEGILIYPTVDAHFSFDYRLAGRRVRVLSIDLDQPWTDIRDDLLEIIVERTI